MGGVSEGYIYRGREVPVSWNGAEVRAWVPAPLTGQAFDLGLKASRLTERAAAAAVAAGNRSAHFGPLATLLLRSEGVASSYLEGLQAPLADVAAADVGGALSDAASYVADNLGAVMGALASPERALTEKDILGWHRRLTESSGALPPRMVGTYRTEQSWVGGTSPRDAAFVPPPPELLGGLMEDLVSFANDVSLDPVTQAAVVHAQFESIHPFGDGNGRIGRVLIGWVLSHRLALSVPPPLSVVIARDPGGYLAGLTLFRMGQLDPWVEWMAGALERSGDAANQLMARSRRPGGRLAHPARRGARGRRGAAGDRPPRRAAGHLGGGRRPTARGLGTLGAERTRRAGRTRHRRALPARRVRPRPADALLGGARARRARFRVDVDHALNLG